MLGLIGSQSVTVPAPYRDRWVLWGVVSGCGVLIVIGFGEVHTLVGAVKCV